MERKVREDSLYSKECIVDAFLFILATKRLQDITITEICQKAGVARITFYKYYKTINDVLKSAVDYKFKLFRQEIDKHAQPATFKQGLEICISAIQTLRKPLRMLAKSNMSGILLQYFTDSLLTLFPETRELSKSQRTKYLFISGGIFNILTDWVASGMKDSTPQLAEQIYEMLRIYLKV